MKIAFVGYGQVGGPLADHLQRVGHDVTLAASDVGSESVKKALSKNPHLKVLPPVEAVRTADVVFLATPFGVIEQALAPLVEELTGKILVDCTNPVGPNLTHGLNSEKSGTQVIQNFVPGGSGCEGIHDLRLREL